MNPGLNLSNRRFNKPGTESEILASMRAGSFFRTSSILSEHMGINEAWDILLKKINYNSFLANFTIVGSQVSKLIKFILWELKGALLTIKCLSHYLLNFTENVFLLRRININIYLNAIDPYMISVLFEISKLLLPFLIGDKHEFEVIGTPWHRDNLKHVYAIFNYSQLFIKNISQLREEKCHPSQRQ